MLSDPFPFLMSEDAGLSFVCGSGLSSNIKTVFCYMDESDREREACFRVAVFLLAIQHTVSANNGSGSL